MLNESVDWRHELGGGTRIALVQAGVFTTDAGAIFGPVPRPMWERLVEDEINPDSSLNQALNCLLVETPAAACWSRPASASAWTNTTALNGA